MAMAAKEMKMEATPRMSMATRTAVFCFSFCTLIGSAGFLKSMSVVTGVECTRAMGEGEEGGRGYGMKS